MDTLEHEFGPFVFDRQRRMLFRSGSPVAIGQKCLAVLECLLTAEGRAVSKSDLLDAVWHTKNIEESNLAVQIAALRKCLGKSRNGQDWIATVQRVGYQFVNPDQAPANLADLTFSALESATEKPTVGVLPFVNRSDDPDQDLMCEGITEDIITELSRWRRLSVRSRFASFRYRGMTADTQEIARDLDVHYIVEGSLRRKGDRIRLSAQLIDAETGNHLWADNFDLESVEIFAVQDRVVRRIVSTLVGRVEVVGTQRANRKPPANLAAYECVLKGNALPWDEPAGATEAIRLFTLAIELDPDYGFAHALLANMFGKTWAQDHGSSDQTLKKALDFARRAVELDSGESSCFSLLGQTYLRQRSYEVALQNMQHAIDINPTNQWSNADMGTVLTYCGQAESAIDWFARAREIDPYFGPPWYWFYLGLARMLLHEYDGAMVAFEHVRTRNYWYLAIIAGCHARLADMDRAADFARECLEIEPRFSIRHRLSKEPFRNSADAAHLAESIRLVGLPD